MIENNWIVFLALLLLGALMGLAYLGILWISVKKFSRNAQSVFQTVFGFFIRLALIGVSLFFIAKWFQLQGVLFYLLGFFIVKKIVQRKIYGYHS